MKITSKPYKDLWLSLTVELDDSYEYYDIDTAEEAQELITNLLELIEALKEFSDNARQEVMF